MLERRAHTMRRLVELFIRWTARSVVRLYYPRIEVTGGDRVPRSGGVLLVANHANSLLDPVMVEIAAKRPVRFFAKAPLFETPLLGPLIRTLGMLPAYRGEDSRSDVRKNLESLERGAMALAAGTAVGIFPEGKSHDSLQLEKIKSGTARMAVQAAASGAKPLLIVPIGINYQRKQQFRTGVWLRVGEPIDVARILEEASGDERAASRMATSQIETSLKTVVLHLNDASYAAFLDDLEVFLPPPKEADKASVSAVRQRKRIADAMNHFLAHEPARAEEIEATIRDYRSKLAAAGLVPRSPVMRFRRAKLFFTMLCEATWLTFWFPAATIGAFFHIVPFTLVRLSARRIQDGPTTTALSRLALGLPVYGLWYAGAWLALRSYFLPWVAWTVVSFMPMAGILALGWIARAREACEAWMTQWRVLLGRGQLAELRREQENLRQRLQQMSIKYGELAPREQMPAIPRWRLTKKFMLRWAAVAFVAAALFVAQNSWLKHRPPGERMPGLNVGGMPRETLQTALDADEKALANILTGIKDLESRALKTKEEFDTGKRNWYRQSDDDAVRQLLLTYWNYRSALIRIIWKYQGYAEVPEETERLRCFLASYASACALYQTSLKLVTMFQTAPDGIRKLNEPEPIWNIPAGVYDQAKRNLVDPENLLLLGKAHRTYRNWKPQFAQHDLAMGNYALFHAAVEELDNASASKVVAGLGAAAATPLGDAASTGKDALYQAQRFISTWVGDTKIREPRNGASLISASQVKKLRTQLRPGDVILERRNWYLSNAFLPGYWPHSALYIGSADEVSRAGLDHDPRVQRQWQQFTRRDRHGNERVVMEAISEGVVFTTLEHSVGEADSVAVLRPRLSVAQINEAIGRAFSHAGKPYDFEFDFFSTDKLVCSELVYRAYDGAIRFPLIDVLGRKTLPPIELVKQCAAEHATSSMQFDVIAFLDGSEKQGRAEVADEKAFYETAKRPALTWQQK
jgi:1-acyl-sn-glycerol-3-phosphate acyltransferase